MRGSEPITTLPSRLSESLFWDFSAVDCPLEPGELSVYMVWHERKHADAAHRWLRRMTRVAMGLMGVE